MTKKGTSKSAALHFKNTQKACRKRRDIRRLKSKIPTPTPTPTPQAMSLSESSRGEEAQSGRRIGDLEYGHVSIMGRRRVMEDTVTVAPPGLLAEEYLFFGVYDGHGGDKVAEKCREKMHKCLEKHIEKAKKMPEEKKFDWEKVMVECFRSMDEDIEDEVMRREAEEERTMGSTATVVLVGKEEVVAANCGDSRAVLYRDGVVMPLSRDHKPDRADEKERIEAAGGKVLNWDGWRVQGVLATSRSLGDQYLKPYVTSEPEVIIIKRAESDEFLIIATDGLFDVVGNEIACRVVKRCLSRQHTRQESEETNVSRAAEMLAELAIAKGSRDNISVIVVQLK